MLGRTLRRKGTIRDIKARFSGLGAWFCDTFVCAAANTLEFWKDGTQMRLGNVLVHFNLVVLSVWFLDQQHQEHLRTCYNSKFSCSTPDLILEVLGVGPNRCF